MAELNFNEQELQTQPTLYELYTKLYDTFNSVAQTPPPEEGEDVEEYSKTCMKNSAYSIANAIFTSLDVEHYHIEIVSSAGTSFSSGQCNTTLKAVVFYKGKILPDDEVENLFALTWSKYSSQGSAVSELVFEEHEVVGSGQSIHLDCPITACDLYVCKASLKATSIYIKSAAITLTV